MCVNGADGTIAGAAACLPGDRCVRVYLSSRAALSCEFKRQAPREKNRVLRWLIWGFSPSLFHIASEYPLSSFFFLFLPFCCLNES